MRYLRRFILLYLSAVVGTKSSIVKGLYQRMKNIKKLIGQKGIFLLSLIILTKVIHLLLRNDSDLSLRSAFRTILSNYVLPNMGKKSPLVQTIQPSTIFQTSQQESTYEIESNKMKTYHKINWCGIGRKSEY